MNDDHQILRDVAPASDSAAEVQSTANETTALAGQTTGTDTSNSHHPPQILQLHTKQMNLPNPNSSTTLSTARVEAGATMNPKSCAHPNLQDSEIQTSSAIPPQPTLNSGYQLPSSPRQNVYYPQELSDVKRFELFRQVIQHEDDLLNQRVSWIILAQSFLMAAFVTNTSDSPGVLVSKCMTAGVGLATVLVTLPAIVAAGRNIEVQQQIYFAGLESDAQCWALHGHSRRIGIPPTLEEQTNRRTQGHIFPNTAFRGKHYPPILNTVLALAFVQVVGWCGLLVALAMES